MTASATVVPSAASKHVVWVALCCNVAIAAGKYAAALVSGSPAMLAEAFHSTADIGVELFLLVGMKRSTRPPDALHPFGHGKALYFYSFLVAVYVFGVGGGLAIYHGISHLRHPEVLGPTGWNYLVLGIAGAFDLYSSRVSYRELQSRKDPQESTWEEIIGSKDPTVFTVFLEDVAGLIGTFLAFLGIFLSHMFKNPYYDPAASVLIGVLMAIVALLMGRESGALLIGERTNRAKIRRVRDIIRADPSVASVGDLLTMQLGPDEVLLAVDIRFQRGIDVQQIEAAIDRLESRIQQVEPTIKRIFIEADSLRQKAPSA